MHGAMESRGGCESRPWRRKVEADEAIAVASVISINRTEYMRADKVIGLEYLEHERQTWLWRWGGVGGVGGGEGGGDVSQ